MALHTVPFSEREMEYLRDILDWWIEGHDPAIEDVMLDRLHDSPEQLLEAIDGMNVQNMDARRIRDKLHKVVYGE